MYTRRVTNTNHRFWLCLIGGALAAFWVAGWGCGSKSSDAEEEHEVVPPGKADNFYSNTAQEFVAKGTSTVTLEDSYATEGDATKLARAQELADAKTAIIATYLNYYVVDKSSHSSNPEYGGFHAMARPASYGTTAATHVQDLTYAFDFTGEIGAARDFLSLIPTVPATDPPPGSKILRLQIPLMNAAHVMGTWKNQPGWSPSSFNPESFEPQDLEPIDLTVTPEDISADAYLDYTALLADGKITVGIHFGYDYNDQRYDISEARETYSQLVAWGFQSPVENFEALEVDSGLFLGQVEADGRDIAVEIKLVHADMVDPVAEGAVLKAALTESLETREVILFNGHAGYSGRLLPGNWRSSSSGIISPEEITQLNLPASYQILLVNGCDTYAKFADEFKSNAAKHDADGNLINMDILTTTSFSWLSQMGEVTGMMMEALTGGYDRDIKAYTWDRLLTDINNWRNRDVYFGVHGLDNDPKIHPFANLELLCTACSRDDDCGGQGNQCVKMVDGSKHCAPICLDDSGCPEETTCQNVATGSYITTKACVPVGMSCNQPAPQSYTVMINEVLADPPPDLAGDANGDGVRSFKDDEFVEILNVSAEPADLSGWTLADGYQIRVTFEPNTILAPGQVLLVFGGGDPLTFNLPGDAMIVIAVGGLTLTNTGDSVYLSDTEGNVVDAMTYGSEGGQNRSLNRASDGDPEASFIPHTGAAAFSPGTRMDGSPL